MESQRMYLNSQRRFIRPPLVFNEIRDEDNIQLTFRDSRIFISTLSTRRYLLFAVGLLLGTGWLLSLGS